MNTLTQLKQLLPSISKTQPSSSVDMQLVASVILGGGRGSRLHPLTLHRCKPAINFGGNYCLIDVPISHSIHANCKKTYILTQFLSSPLHRHISQTYLQNSKFGDSIEFLTAEQTHDQSAWFQGTADAVRQNLNYLLETSVEYFLILSGDQLYNIDFQEMLKCAQRTDADVVIATLPVDAKDASRMGILKVNQQHFITDFYEKPKTMSILKQLSCCASVKEQLEIASSSKTNFLGSMGIYLFKRQALVDLLKEDQSEDFGKHLLPRLVEKGRAAVYFHKGYWEDIGTIESFYKANIALTRSDSKFSCYDSQRPLFTRLNYLAPTKLSNVSLNHALICEGSTIEASKISYSIIGSRSTLHKGVIIRDSYLIGNDYYESNSCHSLLPSSPSIGENTFIKQAIIDKNVHIGKNVRLENSKNIQNYDSKNIFIRDGIIIVPQGAIIEDGFSL